MYTPQGDPHETFWENHVPVMSLFSTPLFGPPKVPGPKCRPEGSRFGPGTKKNKKMRAEKWCRIPPELIQTEPRGASYGQKPF